MDTKEFKVTQEQIQQWKDKFGEVFQLDVEGHVCYLKKPSRKVISMAITIGQNDPIKFSELMLNNCWIDGDELIKTDDELFLSAAAKLSELVQLREAELKKL